MNMHELGMNMAWTVHEVTIFVGINSIKYGPKFLNFMGVAGENLLCFEHALQKQVLKSNAFKCLYSNAGV